MEMLNINCDVSEFIIFTLVLIISQYDLKKLTDDIVNVGTLETDWLLNEEIFNSEL